MLLCRLISLLVSLDLSQFKQWCQVQFFWTTLDEFCCSIVLNGSFSVTGVCTQLWWARCSFNKHHLLQKQRAGDGAVIAIWCESLSRIIFKTATYAFTTANCLRVQLRVCCFTWKKLSHCFLSVRFQSLVIIHSLFIWLECVLALYDSNNSGKTTGIS